MKIDKGKHDRLLESQHQLNMDRERRAGDHKDEMWSRVDEEKWRSELPAQRRKRHEHNTELYNTEVEKARLERTEDEREEKEEAKLAYLHLQAEMRAQRRARREEELLELVSETKEDFVYVPPRGRPEYRSRQREIDLDRISSDVSRRRSEQEERLAMRAAEGLKTTSSYGRYLEQEDKRAERIKRREADIHRTSGDSQVRSTEQKDKLDEERRGRRAKEREEAKQRDIDRHPLLAFDFDERGKLQKNPASREKGDDEEEASRRMAAELQSVKAQEEEALTSRRERRARRENNKGGPATAAERTTIATAAVDTSSSLPSSGPINENPVVVAANEDRSGPKGEHRPESLALGSSSPSKLYTELNDEQSSSPPPSLIAHHEEHSQQHQQASAPPTSTGGGENRNNINDSNVDLSSSSH